MLRLVKSWTKLLPRLQIGNKDLIKRLVESDKNSILKVGVMLIEKFFHIKTDCELCEKC